MIQSNSVLPTPAHIAAYRRDGVALLKGALDADSLTALRQGADTAIASFPDKLRDMSRGKGGAFALNFVWRRVSQYELFVRAGVLSKLAMAFLDTDAVVFVEDELFVKSPGVYAPTPWHHDRPYYPLSGGVMCSIWIPLNPVQEDSALEFVATSHRWGSEFLPLSFRNDGLAPGADPSQLPPGIRTLPDIDALRDKYHILSWAMEPGDILVFDGLTVHGNPANRSSHTSRRISFRFFSCDAVYAPTRYPWTRRLSEVGVEEPEPGVQLAGVDFPTFRRP